MRGWMKDAATEHNTRFPHDLEQVAKELLTGRILLTRHRTTGVVRADLGNVTVSSSLAGTCTNTPTNSAFDPVYTGTFTY